MEYITSVQNLIVTKFKKTKKFTDKWLTKKKNRRKVLYASLLMVIVGLVLMYLTAYQQAQLREAQLKSQIEQAVQELEQTRSEITELEKAKSKNEKKLQEKEKQEKKYREQIEKLEELVEARKERERRLALVQPVQASPPPPRPVTGTCRDWMVQAGVTDMANAYELIMRESGCDPTVWNKQGSGACGIPQALPCSKLPNGIHTHPVEQIRWMQNYVIRRYKSWAGAIQFHNINNWY